MLLSSKFSLRTMVTLCQAFRVAHGAGLPLVDVFKQQGSRGPLQSRPVISRIAERLADGDSLEEVLKHEGSAFPPLFTTMVVVGEQTGNLPEIFKELERHFREQLTLRRQFISQITLPVFELVAAIGVIALMILILGWLPTPPSGKPWDPLGFGVGPEGVAWFLGTVGAFFGGLFLIYFLVTRALGQRAAVHRVLLSVPIIGPCLHALALTRLSLALHMTLDSSLHPAKAVKLSLLASGNGAYEACADAIASAVKGETTVTDAFAQCRIFPEEFVQAIHTGEESGQIPEVMGRQAAHYQEEASMKMAILTRVASFGVWAFIAILIIYCIFRIMGKIMGIYDAAGSTDLSQPLY